MTPPFAWDSTARRFRDRRGRYVPAAAVRQATDEAIDSAASEIVATAQLLQSGAINLPEWQIRMERQLKALHAMAGAVAAGGWQRATSADWSVVGRRLRAEYGYLDRFAREIANGLPLDARFLARAAMYASAASGTYEAVLRRADLATGRVLEERRAIHSGHPCGPCKGYAALGWRPPGTLPGIGEACACLSRCRCSFRRRLARAASGAPRP